MVPVKNDIKTTLQLQRLIAVVYPFGHNKQFRVTLHRWAQVMTDGQLRSTLRPYIVFHTWYWHRESMKRDR